MSGNTKGAAAQSKVKGKFTLKAAPQPTRGKAPMDKRKRPADDDDDASADNEMSDDEDYGDEEDEEEEADTDDEIAAAHAGKSKKTAKRKRRATSPTTFGATMLDLLGGGAAVEDAGPSRSFARQQPAILSLAPHVRRGAQSSRLNAKAARIALAARRKREDRAHVTDVIGGWGAPGVLPKTSDGDEKSATQLEAPTPDDAQRIKSWLDEGGVQGYEKRLRKVAQRGVVKLFNAIRAAQNTTAGDLDEATPVAATASNKAAGGTKGENPLGGKMKAVNELSKNNFFDLLRGGTKA